MARHKKEEQHPDEPTLDGVKKAQQFDQQFAASVLRAEQKRENGEYPYDLDRKAK